MSVEVTAAVPVTSGAVGLRLQVAGLVAAAGVTAQVRSTVPVKPLDGVTEMVEVLFGGGSGDEAEGGWGGAESEAGRGR